MRLWLRWNVLTLFKIAVLQFEDDGKVRKPSPVRFANDEVISCSAKSPHPQSIGQAVFHQLAVPAFLSYDRITPSPRMPNSTCMVRSVSITGKSPE